MKIDENFKKRPSFQMPKVTNHKRKTMSIEKIFEIKINSSEINKDNAFEVLRTSKLSIICLEDEKYIVPARAMVLLRREGVTYDILKINGVKYDPKNPS